MLTTRVIPALLLRDDSLVKTVQFGKYTYVGDPCNTLRIFNELEVDELLLLDITTTSAGRPPNLNILSEIADECFMPLGYGGGIRSVDQAKAIFDIGFEKVAINSYAVERPDFVTDLARHFGSQAVIASIDVSSSMWGRKRVSIHSGRKHTRLDPVAWAREVESRGAGEILLTSIDREGTWRGFDLELVRTVSEAVGVPVIAHGGAGRVDHISEVVKLAGASAVALGSMIVFQSKGMGVLVNFPDRKQLERIFEPGSAG